MEKFPVIRKDPLRFTAFLWKFQSLKIDILAGTFRDVLHAGMFLASEFSEIIVEKNMQKTYENLGQTMQFWFKKSQA